jgi:hypothetical protein
MKSTVAKFDSPFHVDKVHTNGMVTIDRPELVSERFYILWIKPYRVDPFVGGE